MATQWVLGKVSEALAPTVSSTVASAGAFAGGAVNAVGNSINGVGESINSTIRRYGDGVKDYGNGVMDWTQAAGPRAATASNPLGLSAGKTGGRRQVTSPQIYRQPVTTPKSSPSKTLMTTNKTPAPQKKIEGGTPMKALPAPGPKLSDAAHKATAVATPAKKVASAPRKPVQSAVKTSTVPNPGAMRQHKQGNGASKAAGATKSPTTPNPGAMRRKPADDGNMKQPSSVKKVTPVKPNTASAPKPTATAANRPKVQGNPTAAANPLGLTF
ncbi:uncharacterized protein A1O5_12070 [Cladophialophora psammophila CBS 110553]|uniref:Uncharacterized protein n=1 Tax=Cladophialophora psammophila CBS 110553 TaxID=1182543 RepID=W9W372_9EURO|nr:uncharacterized protein A1O5_12070 [Cladophialophora psammophila CBS 110553]EXJ59445.1 hypothetical protein A1O5_12070 [Cladophialophora psammophila CBS 110553]